MKKKTEEIIIEPITWFCKRCGSANGNTYKCDGMYKQRNPMGQPFWLPCRNTPIYNKIVSKYRWSQDGRRSKFNVKSYKEYVEVYA